MAQQRASLKHVVNEALRRGLAVEPAAKPKKRFRVVPHSFGFRSGIDVNKLNQLLDELEAQAFAKAQARKKRR